MKTRDLTLGVCALMLGWLTACQPKNVPEPVPQDDPAADTTATDEPEVQLPSAFPKKHLIEEFTGQDCGYCPYGMDCVHQFVDNDTNWVVVLHHYGYSKDHFSVAGSQSITRKLSVNGAPAITVDRDATKSDAGRTITFHPGYLPSVSKTQFEDSTIASIVITNTYDASARKLQVHISGYVLGSEPPALKLTALVKESGMIDYQQDFYATFEGWQEFRHCNAVRAFLTDPLGDAVTVSKHAYEADYELDIPAAWVADNCAVVALLSQDFKPVVQVEQRPVVPNTAGGADIRHGGITAVPVSDYYPEPGATTAPQDYSGVATDTLNAAGAYYTPYPNYGFNLWQLQAYNPSTTVTINNTPCVPFANIMLFTPLTDTAIPNGTYPLLTTLEPGTAYAGFRDDEQFLIDGSQFYYTSSSYLEQGYLVPEVEWLIADGTLTISRKSWKLEGHARNGAVISLYGSTTIQNWGASNAPRRARQQPRLGVCDATSPDKHIPVLNGTFRRL